jgi:hypothetical protein
MSALVVSEHLLPAGASIPERAAASLGILTARLDDPIGRMADPVTVPIAALPHLAWGYSVDAYDAEWRETRKRAVVGEWVLYHERKTTVAGIRMALGYRDATLVGFNLPRHGFFCGGVVSVEEEERWLAGLPEIRIFDPQSFTLPGPVHRFAGVNMIARGDARLARRAVLIRAGVQTPLSIVPSGDLEKITAPIGRKHVLLAGRAGSRIVASSDLNETVFAIRPVSAGTAFVRPAATRGDQGTFVSSSRKLIEGKSTIFTPAGRGGLRIAAPVAIAHGYLSLKFSGTPGQITSRRAANVVGRSRVTRKAYSAAWTVDWSRPVPRSRFPAGRICAARSEPQVASLMDAILSASALRDENSITLTATQRLTYADLRAAKTGVRYGQRKRISSHV